MVAADLLRKLDLSSFLRWWAAELAAALPPRAQRLIRGRPQRLVLEVEGERVAVTCHRSDVPQDLGHFPLGDLAEEQIEKLREQLDVDATRCPALTVRLPAELALQKVVALPLAAEENLRQVLTFEMDRQTPFKTDQVYFDYEVLARDSAARRLRVRLTTVPRRAMDAVLGKLEVLGVQPDRVEVVGTAAVNLLPPERRQARGHGSRRLHLALGAVAVLLLLAAVAIPLWQEWQQVLTLRPQVASAQREAEQVLSLRDSLDRAIKESRLVLDKRRQTPLLVDVLNQLTHLLPDGTWLSSFELKGNELRIQGESTGASALVGVLEASPRFSQVRFSSPVTQNPATGRERFQLSATVDPYPMQ
jgi:general secretion pathway protein L